MKQSRGNHADFKRLHLVDASDEEDEHQNHSQAELNPKLSVVTFTKFPAIGIKTLEIGSEVFWKVYS